MEAAHEGSVFALDWHPLGHILVSGSNDHTTRFWTRNRPGDAMNDRFNLTKEDADALGIKPPEMSHMMGMPDLSSALPGLGQGNRPMGDFKSGGGSYSNRGQRDRPQGGQRQSYTRPDHQNNKYNSRQDQYSRQDQNSTRQGQYNNRQDTNYNKNQRDAGASGGRSYDDNDRNGQGRDRRNDRQDNYRN